MTKEEQPKTAVLQNNRFSAKMNSNSSIEILCEPAIKRKETSKLKINHFKEIELNTGLKHGFLYIASDEWIKPCKMWAKRNYELKE